LELIIVPPWWRTPWFRVAVGLLVLGAAAGFGGVISTRRARARLVEMERERQLAREREQAHAEREKAHAEREKLQAQLTQAQKMESVGRLAGGVAHDFNNMLQAILGNAALALEDLPPGSPARESLEEIEKSAQRSADLTRQLLAFARKQTIAPRVLDLNETVAGMLKMLRRLIGEDIELAWRPGAKLWPVKMDPSQIDQVLANLCVNARDAIGGVGQVIIETANTTFDDTYVDTHPEVAAGDYVLLAVSDTGKGMDAATRAHLFEPFFTTKEQGKGTGLGLATVFGIVKQNRGVISVYSEPGQGTTFKIYLPRAGAAAPRVAPDAARQSPRGVETVLLVEDEEQVLNLGRRLLELQGYTVLVATSPEGPIHLLITDVVMPGMNGRQLCERIHASRPELKCLYMSGYTADVIGHHGVLDAGVAFLQKPFTVRSLAEKVREVLGANREASSQP
jgi:signal transduction histidine kinase